MGKVPYILLVDDNEADNVFHERVIKQTGVPVELEAITDSRKAFEFLEKGVNVENGDENFLPDIVFLDINMPAINGFELLDKFRKIPDPYNRKKKTKFFILSTSPNSYSTPQKTYGEVIGKYLTKPLTSQVFLDILNNRINRQ